MSKRQPANPRLGVALLARQLVRDLFTNGAGQRAERLVLTIDGPPKRDLGGWGERAMVDKVEAALLRARYKPVTGRVEG